MLKQGMFKDFLSYIVRLIIILILATSVIAIVQVFNANSLNTKELEMNILFQRIYYSDIITYEEGGKLQTGIIDLNKFKTENLDEQINYTSPRHIAARLTIKSPGEISIQAFLNEKWFERWKQAIDQTTFGSSAHNILKKKIPISIMQGGILKKGTLEALIIMPK